MLVKLITLLTPKKFLSAKDIAVEDTVSEIVEIDLTLSNHPSSLVPQSDDYLLPKKELELPQFISFNRVFLIPVTPVYKISVT